MKTSVAILCQTIIEKTLTGLSKIFKKIKSMNPVSMQIHTQQCHIAGTADSANVRDVESDLCKKIEHSEYSVELICDRGT